MFRQISILLIVMFVLLLGSTSVLAEDPGYPWRDHEAPFDFEFGNLIDNHQQTKLTERGMLQGYIYVQFTGDTMNGVPIAIRADCTDPALDCRVGWKIKAIPFKASLVSTGPRVWLVNEEDLPPASKYLHFHWDGRPWKPCKLDSSGNTVYDGYLMQRTAVTTFYWLGGNPSNEHGGHLVTPGMDYHSNIVTDEDQIGGGGHGGGSGGHDEGGCGGHDGGSGEPGGEDDGGSHDGGPGGPGDSGGHDDGGGHDGGLGGPGGLSWAAPATTVSVLEFAPGMKMAKTTVIRFDN